MRARRPSGGLFASATSSRSWSPISLEIRFRSHLLRAIRCIGEVATTSAVRLPPESIPISPKTSPGPSEPITSPLLITSAVPDSITIRS